MNQDGEKSIAQKQPLRAGRSGYHYFMDRLREKGNLYFLCACGVTQKVEDRIPLLVKCFCEQYMAVVDREDLP